MVRFRNAPAWVCVPPRPAGSCIIMTGLQMLERLRDTQTTRLVSRLHVAVAHLYLKDSLLLQVYQHMKAQDTEFCFYGATLEPTLEKVADLSAEIGLAVANDTQLPILQKMASEKNCGSHFAGCLKTDAHSCAQGPSYGTDALFCSRCTAFWTVFCRTSTFR